MQVAQNRNNSGHIISRKKVSVDASKYGHFLTTKQFIIKNNICRHNTIPIYKPMSYIYFYLVPMSTQSPRIV